MILIICLTIIGGCLFNCWPGKRKGEYWL
jgi:hypothetical protein